MEHIPYKPDQEFQGKGRFTGDFKVVNGITFLKVIPEEILLAFFETEESDYFFRLEDLIPMDAE